jgi:hypothetical protein
MANADSGDLFYDKGLAQTGRPSVPSDASVSADMLGAADFIILPGRGEAFATSEKIIADGYGFDARFNRVKIIPAPHQPLFTHP